jgi:uncharacterized protein YbjQ (UPF0145 family)
MSLTTSSQYDSNLWEVKGMLLANHTEAVSILRGFMAGVGGIFGGKSDIMNKKVDDVMSNLIQKLKAQIGPGEMVVAAHFQFTEFGRDESNTFLSGIATGTLLKRKGAEAPVGGRRNTTRKNRKMF